MHMKKISILFWSMALLLAGCQSKQGIQVSETKQVCQLNVISAEHLTDLLYSGDLSDVQFIDVRTPHAYAMGHLPGAINIPAKNFFDDKYLGQIRGEKVLLIYGADDSMPELLSMMAKHFRNIHMYAVLGSYDYIRNRILDHYGIYSGIYDDEVPVVDFKKAIREIRQREGGGAAPAPATKPVAVPKPVVKHKKKEVTGGCG